jgi:hypothetical protein
MALAVGDLVSSSTAPDDVYRVTSKPARDVLRLLPFGRSGREVMIMRVGSRWTDGSTSWKRSSQRGSAKLGVIVAIGVAGAAYYAFRKGTK